MDLVTGATGIVGAHVLLECARKGPVRVIHRAHGDRSIVERIFRHYGDEGQLSRVQWQQADVEDVDALSDAMLGIRYVYHAAAIVSFDPRDATAMHRVNVRGTARVVNTALAQGVERLCHVSSTAAIGAAGAWPCRKVSSSISAGCNGACGRETITFCTSWSHLIIAAVTTGSRAPETSTANVQYEAIEVVVYRLRKKLIPTGTANLQAHGRRQPRIAYGHSKILQGQCSHLQGAS